MLVNKPFQSIVACLLSICLFGCVSTSKGNLPASENKSFEQKKLFQTALEQSMPMLLFIPSFELAQVSYTIPGLYIEKPVNPFDPSFAECMNEAIVSKSYQSSLDQAVTDYFAHANHTDYEQDFKLLTSSEYKQEIHRFSDLFAVFTTNQTLKENQDIFYPRFSNETNTKSVLTPSPYLAAMFDVNKKTPLGDYINNQIIVCHKVQKLS